MAIMQDVKKYSQGRGDLQAYQSALVHTDTDTSTVS